MLTHACQLRMEQRELACAFPSRGHRSTPPFSLLPAPRTNMKLSQAGVVQAGAAAIKVDDKYAHMAKAQVAAATTGAADAAWDD